jgi:hypothetical protein
MTDRGSRYRPGSRWCTSTAIRLLRIAAREPIRPDALLDADAASTLLKAAAILDVYGQAVDALRAAHRGATS